MSSSNRFLLFSLLKVSLRADYAVRKVKCTLIKPVGRRVKCPSKKSVFALCLRQES